MKTRYSFVSNSSTTSFCLVGLSLFEDDEVLNLFDIKEIDEIEDGKVDLYIHPDCEYYYIGVDIHKMRDNQTLGEFKKEALETINKRVKKGKELTSVSIMTAGWYDG